MCPIVYTIAPSLLVERSRDKETQQIYYSYYIFINHIIYLLIILILITIISHEHLSSKIHLHRTLSHSTLFAQVEG